MLHLNNTLMPDLLDGHLLYKYISHLDLHLKGGWQYLGYVILSLPHLRRRAWGKKHSPLPPKMLCRKIKDAWCRQNSAGESPWHTETLWGSGALYVCWTLSSEGFWLSSCHTWELLLLHHSRPLGPALPSSTHYQCFPSQSRYKQ